MASRKDQKERLRAEREARERAAQSSDRRRRMVGLAVAAVLVVAAIVAIVVVVSSGGGSGPGGSSGDSPEPGQAAAPTDPPAPSPDLVANLTDAAKVAGCTLDSPKEEGNDHVEGTVQYEANPPTSGNHFIIPTEDGAYAETPPTEQVLHALEHGRVYIQYAPDINESVKSQLQGLFDEDPYHMVLSPNGTDMPYAVAVTAWNQVLACEEPSDGMFDAIRAFREQYRDQGPEFVP